MESWPQQKVEFRVSREEVAGHLRAVQAFLSEEKLDAVVINSADRFQNEYTPLEDNHRYYLSGFSGSTALLLVPREGRARLYVDGRYHLQADQEVDAGLIEVVKVQFSVSLNDALRRDLEGMKRVAWEGDRVSVSFGRRLEDWSGEGVPLHEGEIQQILGHPPLIPDKPLHFIPAGISSGGVKEKLALVFDSVKDSEATAVVFSALDDIAWLTDARGYHFPWQSSFAAVALAVRDHLYVCVESDMAASLEPRDGLSFHQTSVADLFRKEKALSALRCVQFDPDRCTQAIVNSLKAACSELETRPATSPVVALRARKSASEIEHMEACNARSARAIAKTIRWVRQRLAAGDGVNEALYYEAANGFYAEEGARDLSFHTIAAVGTNTAIIHFTSPSPDVLVDVNDLMLLDSGALYEGGYATDITRCFVAGGSLASPSARQKEIYTLCLKGHLRGMMAVFPQGTRGSFLDALVRAPLYEGGYDYAHGTGHGVGIHVHEPGVGISPAYAGVIEAGHVCSVEPGIYLEGFGGVRHENVVVFEEHPRMDGFLCSRPLNYVGYDPFLVDRSLLNEEELAFYDAYMAECDRRGTTLSD